MSDLLKARTAPDILAALARALIEPCPAEAMPTPAALAEWLHDCPEAAFDRGDHATRRDDRRGRRVGVDRQPAAARTVGA